MKKITLLFVLTSFLFNSCTTLKVSSWNETITDNTYDFSKYAEKGFLFYPGEYIQGKFDVIADVSIRLSPTVRPIDCASMYDSNSMSKWYDEGFESLSNFTTHGQVCCVIKFSEKDLVDECYKKCISLGADALVNFKVVKTTKNNNTVEIPIILATGIAIKRK
jgi:hypothetical protein